MRVLYVTANSNLGSTTSSLNAIIRQLRPRGLEPVMLFREKGPWQSEIADWGVSCHFNALRWPEWRHPVRSMLDIARLIRLCQRERIELIHCNEHEHYPLLRHVGRWTGLPVIATLHWNLEPGYGKWAFRPPYLPAALQFLSRKQLELSGAAFPAELDAKRVKLLMSGLDIDGLLSRGDDGRSLRAAWGVDDTTVVIGTASAIKPRKRLQDFIELVGRLRARGLNVLGVMAGGGKYVDPVYHEQLKSLIHERGLDAHCRFIGFVNPIAPFFKACDVTVNTCEMEILCMSLCEAQACARPTLAYAVGGNAETLPEWCTVPFADLDALEEKAVKLVSDPAFRRELGRRSEQFVRAHFDAPILARTQAAIYEGILGDRLAPLTPETAPSASSWSA